MLLFVRMLWVSISNLNNLKINANNQKFLFSPSPKYTKKLILLNTAIWNRHLELAFGKYLFFKRR